jgi:basic membrane protein A
LLACLLLLFEAGSNGASARPTASASASPSAPCSPVYRIAFVTDVGGPAADRDAYRGVTRAAAGLRCATSELISSRLPSDYGTNLQRAALQSDLVIAGSFLLTDAAVSAARANPETHFLVVDAQVPPASLPNLLSLRLRQDESAYLAGALAAMLSKTGIVAGVYGPDGLIDQQQRTAFEHGAAHVSADIRALGAYQPASAGRPYDNPSWGAAQAQAFSSQHADVIFGGEGNTGRGALSGAAAAGRLCIGTDVAGPPDTHAPACLVATTTRSLSSAVDSLVTRIAGGDWSGGVAYAGLDQDAVGLKLFPPGQRPEMERELRVLSDALISGTVSTGTRL